MVTLGLVEDGGDKMWKNLREIFSLRLASEFKSAANSIDGYGIPREKFRTICIARFWIASSC